jgi:hypothetical protein
MISNLFTFDVLMAVSVLAILTACPTYFIYSLARTKPSARPIPYFPHGVHGWLLVFVATVVLSIILTMIDAVNAVNMMQGSGMLNWAVLSPSLVIIGLYVYCLWIIARKREGWVVKQTIVILWVVGPISLLLLSLIFGATLDNTTVVRSCLYAALWTLYFLFSKRVACTYGTKAVDSYIKLAIEMAEAQKAQKTREEKEGKAEKKSE